MVRSDNPNTTPFDRVWLTPNHAVYTTAPPGLSVNDGRECEFVRGELFYELVDERARLDKLALDRMDAIRALIAAGARLPFDTHGGFGCCAKELCPGGIAEAAWNAAVKAARALIEDTP